MDSLLRHLRVSVGQGQQEFARGIGQSQSYVSDVETGRRPMTPAFAMKAAPELGVDPVVLLAGFEYEAIVRKAEEGDPSASEQAVALAKQLLGLLQEGGALDAEQALAIRKIVEKLLKLVEGATDTSEETEMSGTDLAKKANEGSLRWVEQKVMAQLNPPGSQLGAIDAPGVRDYWFVRDVFADTVVVESEQTAQILSYPYQIDESGELVLDEPQEVRLDYVEKPGRRVAGKPATAKKASPGGAMAMLRRMGGLSRVGGLDEDEWYDKLIEEGIAAPALEQFLDQISVRLSSGLISDAERLSLKALENAIERRIAELAGDGDRSSFAEQVGDRAAVKARRSSEAQEARDHAESMRELGLDMHGRVIPQAQRDHDRALKSSHFLSQDEKELGVDRRGLPLTPQRLRDRRYIEEGQ